MHARHGSPNQYWCWMDESGWTLQQDVLETWGSKLSCRSKPKTLAKSGIFGTGQSVSKSRKIWRHALLPASEMFETEMFQP
eukprot:4116195-Amphidinium_carterae.1